MFYVAVRNKETGRFELSWKGDDVQEYYHTGDALTSYALAVKLEGVSNVKLLSPVTCNLKLTTGLLYPNEYGLAPDDVTEITI